MGESVKSGESDFRVKGPLTPLVGRESVIALLLERWEQAEDGEGQVVLLSGEPGIGKSRIAEVLEERLRGGRHGLLRYQCSPYFMNTALYPISSQLEQAAGFTREDGLDARLDKLEVFLGRDSRNVIDIAPFFATILSLLGDRYTTTNLNAEQQKEKTFAAFVTQLREIALENPVLMIFEDVHWIDPTSLELLNAMVDLIRTVRVLLIVTSRPEFESSWGSSNHVTTHAINRLSRRHGAKMVADVIGENNLHADVIEQIVARTDGIPLFVEELTKTVVETGRAISEDKSTSIDSMLTIPATLQDSLMARLDRLVSGKEVAQVAACIGREFSYELICTVAALVEDELATGLRALVDADLIYQSELPPRARYTFKHALIQDTAYQSLLKATRQRLHARIANQLEKLPATVANQPELLALHYTGAGLADQATSYWLKAGERALRRSANIEAVEHLRSGLAHIGELTEHSDRIRRQLALQARLGPALIAVEGYGAPQTARCYDRALELLELVDDAPEAFQILYGCWVTKLTWAEFPMAQKMAEDFLLRAQDGGDTGEVLTGFRMAGFSRSCLGDFTQARENFENLLALYRPDEHGALAYLYGQDPKAAGAPMLAWKLWHLGYPDQAVAVCDEAVRYARELKHTHTRGYVETFGAVRIQLFRGDREGVDRYVNSMLTFYEEHKLLFWLGFAKVFEGWSLSEQGRHEEAIEVIGAGLRAHEQTRTAMFKPHTYAILAQAQAGCGRFNEALQILDDALAIAERTSEHWITPELYRLQGELMLESAVDPGVTTKAQVCFERALTLARQHQAKSWELRSATSLARLWQQQGNQVAARDMLVEIYDWFSEGFQSRDLEQAKSLLQALA